MKHNLKSGLQGEISITSDMQRIAPYGRKWRGTKEPPDESEKASLKFNILKTKIMASGPIISWQIDGETMERVTDLFLGSLITVDGDFSLEFKRHCSLEKQLDKPRHHIKKAEILSYHQRSV